MKKFIYFCLLVMLNSCSWFVDEIPIPSYIHIPYFVFRANDFEGSSSSKIVDSWVFVNGKKIGAFEMPATFPVLDSGMSEIIIFPGIMLNGISATRAIYVFYKPDTFFIDLKPNNVQTIIPQTSYASNTNFKFIEDFESLGLLFTKATRSDTIINIVDDMDLVFEGNRSGEIVLTRTRDYFEAHTVEHYSLPTLGKFSFLEFDCKPSIHFTVGVYVHDYSSTTMHSIVIITPSKEWKKIYVNLTPVIARFPASSNFSIYFAAEYDASVEENRILIDNIKLLHN